MPKRTFWLTTGVALGAGASLWAERKVRRTVEQATAKLQPDALVVEVGRSARNVAESASGRVRDALSTGRDEMQRREEELWADLAAQGIEPVTAAPVAVVVEIEPEVRARRSRTIRRSRRTPATSVTHLDN
jgi:hypothetical protein